MTPLLRLALLVLAAVSLPAAAQVTFTDVTSGDLDTPIRSWGVSLVDVDADGDPDLFVSRFSATGGNALYRNDGGTFTAVDAGPLTTGPGSIGHAWADADNDGDLVISDTGDPATGAPVHPVRLYENETDNGNAWVKFRLEGITSNKAAIGAIVRVTATIGGQSVTQMREVSSQNSFNGHNDLTVHVGLGDATAIATVTWPSGLVEDRGTLAVRGTYVIRENLGVATEPDAESGGLRLGVPWPNPAYGGIALTLSLDEPAHAVAAVYDLTGRRVGDLYAGPLPAGDTALRWEPDGQVAAGLYVVRVQTAEATVSRRVALVR